METGTAAAQPGALDVGRVRVLVATLAFRLGITRRAVRL